MATTAYSPVHQFKKTVDRSTLGYRALVAFTIIYYTRPEDFIPGLAVIPLSKISGGIALIGLLVSLGAKDKPKPAFIYVNNRLEGNSPGTIAAALGMG